MLANGKMVEANASKDTRGPVMYSEISDFLVDLSRNKPLWALFVVGTVFASSMALYSFWEVVLKALPKVRARSNRRGTINP